MQTSSKANRTRTQKFFDAFGLFFICGIMLACAIIFAGPFLVIMALAWLFEALFPTREKCTPSD